MSQESKSNLESPTNQPSSVYQSEINYGSGHYSAYYKIYMLDRSALITRMHVSSAWGNKLPSL